MTKIARPGGPPPAKTLLRLTTGRFGIIDLFRELANDHPRLAHATLGRDHVYAVTSASLVRELLVEHSKHLNKAPSLKQIDLLGNGLLTNDGETWRVQRRLVQPAFHHDRIVTYANQMFDASVATRDSWRDGQHIDVSKEMSALTLSIVGTALFGDSMSDRAGAIGESLEVALGATTSRLPGGLAWLGRVPTPANRRVKTATKLLQDTVDSLIAQRRARPGGNDMLSMLVQATDGDTSMDDRQARDEVMTLILAGHETTAMALTWAWMLLSRDPDATARLHQEVDSVIAESGRVELKDVTRLNFTKAVIAEALRLYPPAWIMGRKVESPFKLDGWDIPAGSIIATSPFALHRDARYWERPERFEPQRWLDVDGTFDDDNPGQPPGAWFPFGMGQRKCVGQVFAWTESVIALATLANRWRVQIPAGHEPTLVPAVTLRPAGGMPATLRYRDR